MGHKLEFQSEGEGRKPEIQPPVSIHWDDEQEKVTITIGDSTCDAYVVNNRLYGGLLEVPQDKRRRGIGSRLGLELIKFAKEHGISAIVHNLQSLEGLSLLERLAEPNRRYYYQGEEEVNLEQAQQILREKKMACKMTRVFT